MPPESDNTQAPDSQATETVTLTTAELNARMAAARRSGIESATRKAEPVSQPVAQVPAQAQPASDVSAVLARMEAMEARNAFDRALLGRNVSAEDADLLHDIYQAKKPTDLRAWMDQTIARFGFAKQPPASNPPNAPAAAPSNADPVPFDIESAQGFISPTQLSPAQLKDGKFLRRVNEHNMAVTRSKTGAPPRRAVPGQKR